MKAEKFFLQDLGALTGGFIPSQRSIEVSESTVLVSISSSHSHIPRSILCDSAATKAYNSKAGLRPVTSP